MKKLRHVLISENLINFKCSKFYTNINLYDNQNAIFTFFYYLVLTHVAFRLKDAAKN